MKTKLLTLILVLAASVEIVIAGCWTRDYDNAVQIGDLYYLLEGQTAILAPGNDGCFYSRASFYKDYQGTITIPSSVEYNGITYSVTCIGSYAFGQCGSITNIHIPNSVTSIEAIAFYGCSSLTSIEIPNSVTSIGGNAFEGCSSLTSIEIPNSVTSIGNYAFNGCTGLTSVTVETTTLPTLGEYAFDNTNDCPIYIPCGTTYPSGSQWAKNASRIIDNRLTYAITAIAENGTVSYPQIICDENVTLTPSANYGYHFVQWSDGNTDNPRAIILTQDTIFTALFAHNPIITYVCNSQMGRITGPSMTSTGVAAENITFEAIPNYGYHFDKWKDGNTDNPRTIWLSQDTTMEVVFAKNTYTISTESANTELGTTSGGTSALYLDEIQISATPNYGYHFDHWEIEKYSESIEYKNIHTPYVVKFSVPDTWTNPYAWVWETGYQGSWTTLSKENGMYVYRTAEDNRNIIIVPNGQEWGNGQTNDLAITESCCYTIGEDDGWRYEVSKTYDCLSSDEQTIITGIDTIAHVDTITSIVSTSVINPLTILVTSNQKAIAHFAKNVYGVTKQCNSEQGYIDGNSQAEYLDEVTITAIPNYGYHFVQWSDGLKTNLRSFVITKDTTFTAEFAVDRTGTCGNDWALTWRYDPTAKALTISGNGIFAQNIQCGVEARTALQQVIFEKGVTEVGASAFANCSNLKTLIISEDVKKIGEQAFYNCENLTAIYNYRPTPTTVYSNTFDGVEKFECTLHVLASSVDMYKAATGWSEFFYVEPIGAEEATTSTDEVTVETTDNTATMTWPTDDNAASYTIQITKDGVVFCTLIFNGNGQLTGIAFAPSKDGSRHAPQAKLTANGMQFTVTGLNSGTHYAFTLTAKDSQEAVLASYTGEFTTTGEAQVPTGIDEIDSSSLQGGDRGRLILRDGQFFILRGDKTYTVTGAEVK